MKKSRIVMMFMVGAVVVSFIVLSGCPLIPLTAPTGFSLEEGSDSVELSWESGSGDGTVVERATDPDGDFIELGRADRGALNYSDDDVAGGSTYYYRIAHYRGENTGAWSEEKSITTGGITDLTLTLQLEGVNVQWEGGNGEGTVIERRKQDGDFEEIARTEEVGYIDDLVGLERAAEYFYRVASYRGDHTGSWSEEKSITIPHANPLEPPDWILGTWNNGNITYEFTSDNVKHTDSSTSPAQTIDFQERNDYFAEEGATDSGYFDSAPDYEYRIELKNNGSVQDTYTFDDNKDGTLEYTVASVSTTITLTKQ
jgi:hypothetical protein